MFSKLGIEQRVKVSGQDCELASRPVLNLSMILHELSTNAMKYGSLSHPDGEVELHVRRHRCEEGKEWLTLEWTERGGPPAVQPKGKGLGTRLIDRGLDPEGAVAVEEFVRGGGTLITGTKPWNTTRRTRN